MVSPWVAAAWWSTRRDPWSRVVLPAPVVLVAVVVATVVVVVMVAAVAATVVVVAAKAVVAMAVAATVAAMTAASAAPTGRLHAKVAVVEAATTIDYTGSRT